MPTTDDLRYAWRSLRRSPRTTAVAVVLLALSLGASTAIFAVVNAVLLRPSTMRTPDRTVVMWQRDDARGTPVVEVSYGEARGWQDSRALDAVGVFSSVNWSMSLLQGESRSRVSFAAVSPSFFHIAGVVPARGRVLTARDEAASAPRVAVLSERLWRQRFAADPGIVGAVIRVQAGVTSPVQTLEVVG